jgi:hypothetical protein
MSFHYGWHRFHLGPENPEHRSWNGSSKPASSQEVAGGLHVPGCGGGLMGDVPLREEGSSLGLLWGGKVGTEQNC